MSETMYFPNLAPSPEDQQQCALIMSNVVGLSPSSSIVKAAINKLTDGTYHTIIAVTGIARQFQSEAKGHTLVASLKQAHRSMLMILEEWKRGRFKDEKK